MAESRDIKDSFGKFFFILDPLNTLKKELEREIYQTHLHCTCNL